MGSTSTYRIQVLLQELSMLIGRHTGTSNLVVWPIIYIRVLNSRQDSHKIHLFSQNLFTSTNRTSDNGGGRTPMPNASVNQE